MNTANANRFGIEIETVGLSRTGIAAAILSVTGGTLYGESVRLPDGRTWTVVPDGSLSGHLNGEIVSPICTYDDLETVQAIVRAVRDAGARVDESCGIHVHIDGSRFTAKTLLNLVNTVCKYEKLIEAALKVSDRRLTSYTKSMNSSFLARLDSVDVSSLSGLSNAWYGHTGGGSRYDQTRYHGLNLNSFFYRGTVEFRYFNGTLHAGEVKSYIQFCLALVDRAQSVASSSRIRRNVDVSNAKWQFKLLIKTLGMVGPEFKTARTHLAKHLAGNGANPARLSTTSVDYAVAAE